MLLRIAAATIVGSLLISTSIFAQHSDIEFGYDSTSSPTTFVFDTDNFTSEGFMFFEAEMEPDVFDPGNFGSDEPGFATNAAEGLLINPNDRIFLRILDAMIASSFGVGFVNYYNPITGLLEASADRRLLVEQNTGGLQDLVINGLAIETGDNPVFVASANSGGNVHDHLFFDLLDDATAPHGAYGLLVQLQADFASNGFGGIDLSSAPFWMIWNHGMDHEDFDKLALPAFGVSVIPEPSSMALLLAMTGVGLFARRRRR